MQLLFCLLLLLPPPQMLPLLRLAMDLVLVLVLLLLRRVTVCLIFSVLYAECVDDMMVFII